MSDYLSSIIAKNLSPIESIRPRPHLRYETLSQPSEDPGLAEAAPEDENQSLSQPVSPTTLLQQAGQLATPMQPSPSISVSRPANLNQEASVPAPGAAASAPVPSPAEPQAAQPYRGRLDLPAGSLSSLGPERVTPQVAEPASPSTSATPERQPATPFKPPLASDPVSGKQPVQAQTRPAEPIAPSLREILVEKTVERTLVPSDNSSVHTSSAAAIKPASLAVNPAAHKPSSPEIDHSRQLTPVMMPLPALSPNQDLAQPAPTVNVTIGRIEVRAAPAPATPRRSSPQPKLMSLDDYLRSRSNGDRG